MSPTTIQLAVGILIAIIGSGALSAVIVKRVPEVVTDAQRLEKVERRLEGLEDQFRMQSDYIAALRMHILEDKGPPPPPWPEGLIA